jgi:Ca2+-binding EF-hand superfamily protein
MQMLQDSDKNSDGKISYAEFKNLLISKKWKMKKLLTLWI